MYAQAWEHRKSRPVTPFNPITEFAARLQPKLRVNTPGDIHEQEADSMADRVMRMPEPPSPGRCACGGGCPRCAGRAESAPPGIQAKHAGAGRADHAAPRIVHDVTGSSGRPLDAATRAFMEPRFGRDFGHVRVHTGAAAARSADAIGARAYTLGGSVVFAHGQYAPETDAGRRLLAHELTHVMQQEESGIGVIQRAEVDDRSCAGLKDIESDLDTFVNKEINDERKAMTPPIFAPLLLLHVMQRLGGRSAISPIETFVESLPASKRTIPPADLAGTKYSGAGAVNNFYHLQSLGVAHVVGSVAKIHGLCIGADKLGHFFDQGFDLFDVASKSGSTAADVENLNKEMEIDLFGLASTGVFSNADMAANRAGMKFYKDLEKNPEKFVFHIRNYITSRWNEQTNPSFYEKQVGGVVWGNLLSGSWKGTFTPGSGRGIGTTFSLSASASGALSGTFELDAQSSPDLPKEITIKNGTITQRTTSVTGAEPGKPAVSATPVSGVSIEFEWERGSSSGKGHLESVDEQTLAGTLGTGTATSGVGTFRLERL
jgi:hypothetical protein